MLRDCSICHVTYDTSDPESRRNHAKAHREIGETYNPTPMKSLPANCACLVTVGSSLWKHRQMYLRASAFKREFKYDTIQWGYSPRDEDGSGSGESDYNARGYLFTDDRSRIVGAAAFRYRSYHDAPNGWGLQWIWFAPQFRRKGYLAKHWDDFKKRYGRFHAEPPVSEAMQTFLRKHGDTDLL